MENTQIQELIEKMLTLLSIEYDSVEIDTMLNQPLFRIKTSDSSKLIGGRGDRIRALNHIIKKTVRNSGIETRFMIDVNDYRSKKIEEVQSTAKMLAERALSLKYDVEMQPMNAYERMIVHAALTDMENISTESAGEGETRRVVIKYIDA